MKRSQSSIHVLIVGIGEYDAKFLPQPEVCHTALRLHDFWSLVDQGDQLMPDHEFGTVSILLSADEDTKTALIEQYPQVRTALRATRANVLNALQAWFDIVGPSDLGILHWIGHGMVTGRDGGKSQGLWCSDISDTQDSLRGLNWSAFERQLRSKNKGRFFCFIDACRSSDDIDFMEADFRAPALATKYDIAARAPMVLQASQLGRESFGFTERDKQDDFRGGTLFSEATLLSLKHFGAVRKRSGSGFHVEQSSIEDPIERKMRQWMRRRLGSRYVRSLWGSFDSVTEMTGTGNRNYPILQITRPMATCDIHWSPDQFFCEVTEHRSEQEQDISERLREFDEGFDIDIDRSDDGKVSYSAKQYKNEGNRGRKKRGQFLKTCPISAAASVYSIERS